MKSLARGPVTVMSADCSVSDASTPDRLGKEADMTSMTPAAIQVVGGIDTHKELHVAAVVDRDDGRLLDTHEFGNVVNR